MCILDQKVRGGKIEHLVKLSSNCLKKVPGWASEPLSEVCLVDLLRSLEQVGKGRNTPRKCYRVR
jgi:hypothetical protein